MRDTSKTLAGFSLFLAMISWAQAPVFIRFLREAYEPFSMAFIRYSSGAAALTLVKSLPVAEYTGEPRFKPFFKLLCHDPVGLSEYVTSFTMSGQDVGTPCLSDHIHRDFSGEGPPVLKMSVLRPH